MSKPKVYTVHGREMTSRDIAMTFGASESTVRHRIHDTSPEAVWDEYSRRGVLRNDRMEFPVTLQDGTTRKMSLRGIAREVGFGYATIYKAVRIRGMSPQQAYETYLRKPARRVKRFPLDGENVSIHEASVMLDINEGTIYRAIKRGKPLQEIADEKRRTKKSKGKYELDGQLVTVSEAIRILHCGEGTVYRHLEFGQTLQEFADLYRSGQIKGGKPIDPNKPRRRSNSGAQYRHYTLNGQSVTVPEAAKIIGCSECTIRMQIRNGVSIQQYHDLRRGLVSPKPKKPRTGRPKKPSRESMAVDSIMSILGY